MYKQQIEGVKPLIFFKDIFNYRFSWFKKDLAAAFTVALVALPQSMAYALVANLPPSVGLVSAIFATFFCALFGSSRHLISGPTNAIAILLQSGTADILYTYFREVSGVDRTLIALQIVAQLTILVGILQVLSGTLKLGSLTAFVSRSVVIGYVVGAALAVVVEQAFHFTGIVRMEGYFPMYEKLWYLFTHIHKVSWPTLTLGILSFVLIIFFKKIHPRFPAVLMMLVVTTAFVFFSELFYPMGPTAESVQKIAIVKDFGAVHLRGLHFVSPLMDIQVIGRLLPLAFAISLLGMLEASSISKSISVVSGQKIAINQEIFGLGMGNLFCSFFGGMVGSGSLSRSMVNMQSGAKSRFAAMMSAVILFAVVWVWAKPVSYVPLASLSALLFITAYKMVDQYQLAVCMRATRSDALVLSVTLVSCILFSLDIAFYIGIVLSITFFLKASARPFLQEYVFENGSLRLLGKKEYAKERRIRIIHIEGELFFGAADLFQAALQKIAEDKEAKVVILRMKNGHHIDATTCLAIHRLNSYLKASRRHLIACGVTPQVMRVLHRSGLEDELSESNIFQEELFHNSSTAKAYQRALMLLERDPSTQQDPT